MDVLNYIMIYTLIFLLICTVSYIIFEIWRMKKRNSLIDISELDNLDKEFKKHYRDIVVKGIMPPIVEKVNNVLEEENINEFLRENKTSLIDNYSKEFMTLTE